MLVLRAGKEDWTSCVVEGHWDGRKVGLDKADSCSVAWLVCNIVMMLVLSTLGKIKLLHAKTSDWRRRKASPGC